MKKTNLRKVALASGVFVAMSMIGCSSKTPTDTNVSAETKIDETASQTSEEEPITLNMWGMSDDEKGYNAIIEAYEKEHPNVNIEMVLYSSSEIDKALTTALAGRDDIDIFVTNGGQFLSAKVATGMAENIDSYIEASGFDTSIYGTDWESCLYNDGSAYGLPYRNSVSLIVYNKDIFDERGVEYPTADTTWDELLDIAEKVTYGEGADKVYGFYCAARNSDWMGPASTNGINYMSEDLTLIQKAMEIKKEACDRGVMLSNAAYTAAGVGVRNMFNSRHSAMYVGGDWTIGQLRGDAADGIFTDNWAVAPMPTLGEGYSHNVSMGQNVYISVCSYSEHKQEAYDFIEYLAGEPGGMIFAGMGTMPGIRTETAKEAFCGDGSQLPLNIEVFFDTATVQGTPVRSGLSELDTFLKAEADLVFSGEQSAEEAVKKLYEEQKKYK